MLKRLSEGVRTFSAIENLILRTFHLSPFLTPPPLFPPLTPSPSFSTLVFPPIPGLVLTPDERGQ